MCQAHASGKGDGGGVFLMTCDLDRMEYSSVEETVGGIEHVEGGVQVAQGGSKQLDGANDELVVLHQVKAALALKEILQEQGDVLHQKTVSKDEDHAVVSVGAEREVTAALLEDPNVDEELDNHLCSTLLVNITEAPHQKNFDAAQVPHLWVPHIHNVQDVFLSEVGGNLHTRHDGVQRGGWGHHVGGREGKEAVKHPPHPLFQAHLVPVCRGAEVHYLAALACAGTSNQQRR